ncbi:MAG: DUF1858 domain-containing protein [Defluviitaleaceae bacterium]|nr:DUF1858 domain-containing protein [Defluviitaleaceae bacterium]
MTKITKDMIITDILAVDRRLAVVLMQYGMRCVGCGAANHETLEQAAAVHGHGPEKLEEMIATLNHFVENADAL